MTQRKLLGRFIFFLCIAVLLVPALWERYQRDFMQLSLVVPPPPRPFVELEDASELLEAPDADDYFAKLYANSSQKVATSEMPAIDDLTSETPRAWVVQAKVFGEYELAQELEAQLRARGLKSYVVPQKGQVGPFSVMVGPFLDYQRTQQMSVQLNELLAIESIIYKFKP